ncbi:hypothetical protein HGRIS_001500 [Hohenbuehelia grisea]|uniref:Uncharacterized protein n=1 Tax=Hohenbuehelia grisea TaxID=104357 RepID=A0ABR3JQJ4_9AGAR
MQKKKAENGGSPPVAASATTTQSAAASPPTKVAGCAIMFPPSEGLYALRASPPSSESPIPTAHQLEAFAVDAPKTHVEAIIDCGASDHYSPDLNAFTDLRKISLRSRSRPPMAVNSLPPLRKATCESVCLAAMDSNRGGSS